MASVLMSQGADQMLRKVMCVCGVGGGGWGGNFGLQQFLFLTQFFLFIHLTLHIFFVFSPPPTPPPHHFFNDPPLTVWNSSRLLYNLVSSLPSPESKTLVGSGHVPPRF